MPPLAKRQRLDDLAGPAKQQPPAIARLGTRRESSRAESPSAGASSSQGEEEDLDEEPERTANTSRGPAREAARGHPTRVDPWPRRELSSRGWGPAAVKRRSSDGATAAMAAAGVDARRYIHHALDDDASAGLNRTETRGGQSGGQDSSSGDDGGDGRRVQIARSAPISRRRSAEDASMYQAGEEPTYGPTPSQPALPLDAPLAPVATQANVPWKTLEMLLREAAAASSAAGSAIAGQTSALQEPPAFQLSAASFAPERHLEGSGLGQLLSRDGAAGQVTNGAAELQDRLRSAMGGGLGSRQPGSGGGSGAFCRSGLASVSAEILMSLPGATALRFITCGDGGM